MKTQRKQAVPPRSEVRDAVLVSAQLGHGLLEVARRHGISTHEAWGMLAEGLDEVAATEFRRGYRSGRAVGMPNLPKGLAA